MEYGLVIMNRSALALISSREDLVLWIASETFPTNEPEFEEVPRVVENVDSMVVEVV